MGQISTLGIDTAKQVFQLHGVDAHGNVVLHKRVSRKQLVPLLAQLPPCLVGLEAAAARTTGPGKSPNSGTRSNSWRRKR
jgi:transposase